MNTEAINLLNGKYGKIQYIDVLLNDSTNINLRYTEGYYDIDIYVDDKLIQETKNQTYHQIYTYLQQLSEITYLQAEFSDNNNVFELNA